MASPHFAFFCVLFLLCPSFLPSGAVISPLGQPNLFPQFMETDPQDAASPSLRFRLPNKVVPRHYDLQIRPVLTDGGPVPQFKAPGTVKITVECLEATNEIVLNAAELDINQTSVRVSRNDNPSLQFTITNQTFNPDFFEESYTIVLAETLAVGTKYDVYIEYVAEVAHPDHRMNGVYYSWYNNDAGQQRYLATTQFSRTRAFRKTLPSFDEPNQKATFAITIGRQEGFHSLSNMDIIRTEPIPGLQGWHWDIYNTTPVMPPTIIAFIVSEFDSETADPSLFDKPTKIWGPPPEIAGYGAVFAAEAAAKTLAYFQDTFQVEYELPKIDSAAIPHFAAGAMENWGLNTYRVEYLIWKEGINAVAEKFRIANIIGHELAHQYWGNLVTHAWWNDWWLTEGFASYHEYRSVDAIYPDFEAMDRLVTSDVQPAMSFDSSALSVPIHGVNDTHFVENPSAINYQKGASLVNMMRNILGEEHFRGACTYYLRKRAYTAVYQDALFTDLTEYLIVNGLPLPHALTMNEIMNTWTLQTAFPLVTVSRAGDNMIYVTQDRFLDKELRANQENQTGLWYVPIFYISESTPPFDPNNNTVKFWLDKSVISTSHQMNTNQWLLVNPNGEAYYRVLYDAHFEGLLLSQLNNSATISSIPVGSRSMIIDDYWSAATQGYIPLSRAFAMSSFMDQETNYNVFVPYLKFLKRLYDLVNTNEHIQVAKNHMFATMATALNTVGVEQVSGEPAMRTITRVQLFDWLCPLAHPDCVAEAERLFTLWKANETVNPIPVDIRPAIYCAALSNPTNGNFAFLRDLYLRDKNPLVRNALVCTPDDIQLESLYNEATTNPEVSKADAIVILERMAASSEGRATLMVEFGIQFPFGKLEADGVASAISGLANRTSDPAVKTRLEAAINRDQITLQPEMTRINAALRRIEGNSAWMEDVGAQILGWMRS